MYPATRLQLAHDQIAGLHRQAEHARLARAARQGRRTPSRRSRQRLPVPRVALARHVRAVLPSSPGALSDISDITAATGSPWPRLAAARGVGTARRLPRWVIVAGIVLLAGSIAATVIVRAVSSSSPRPAAGYLLVAHDAHFTALFPRKPLRIEKTAGTTTVIVYLADLPGSAVGIICAPVPASGLVRLDRAVNVAAPLCPGGKWSPATGSPTTDNPPRTPPYSVLAEPGQIRVVVFGSSAYIFEGFGATSASFAHDYKVLLDTFTSHPSERHNGLRPPRPQPAVDGAMVMPPDSITNLVAGLATATRHRALPAP